MTEKLKIKKKKNSECVAKGKGIMRKSKTE